VAVPRRLPLLGDERHDLTTCDEFIYIFVVEHIPLRVQRLQCPRLVHQRQAGLDEPLVLLLEGIIALPFSSVVTKTPNVKPSFKNASVPPSDANAI
jgi:hypothetical protein